ncbi:MAG: RNA 2',3'-cyclic phosphodiesterase [Patescibacteria group bacterium]
MRLFIAIKIPSEIKEHLVKAWGLVENYPTNCRQVNPQNWHFTLAFLGSVDESRLEPLNKLLQKAVRNPPKSGFLLTDFQTFPPKHPHYIITRAKSDDQEEWIRFINRMRDLLSVAAPDIDRKPWIPHITIARAKKSRILSTWTHPFQPIEWSPKEVVLIKSQLTQSGPQYTELNVHPLNI